MAHVDFFTWFLTLLLLGVLVQCSSTYARMKPRTARALSSSVAVGVLAVAALLSSLIAQTYSISLTATGLSMWLIVDYFVVQALTQWTLLSVRTRQQRIVRGVITGATLVFPLWALAIDIFRL